MNLRQIINKLSRQNGLIISLYLPISPGETRKEFVTTFHSRLKSLRQAAKNLRHKEEKFLDAIIKKIESYLDSVDTHSAKSLVVFAGKNLFEAIKLPVQTPLRSHIDDRPFVSPLTRTIEENPPFLLVLIDRQSARLIEVNIGEEEAKSRILKSDVPQRILAKGADTGRESKILRHIEDHLRRHLEKVLYETKRFEKTFPNGLIVIGAQRELVGKFKRLLPKTLKAKVVGDFGANVDENETYLIKKAQKFVDNYLEREAWHEV
jgi:hypothetical protein